MPENWVKTDAGRSLELLKNPQYIVCFDMQLFWRLLPRRDICFFSFLVVVVFVKI